MDGHRGGRDAAPYRTIEVIPYSPHIGAEIGNIDLTRPLPPDTVPSPYRQQRKG